MKNKALLWLICSIILYTSSILPAYYAWWNEIPKQPDNILKQLQKGAGQGYNLVKQGAGQGYNLVKQGAGQGYNLVAQVWDKLSPETKSKAKYAAAGALTVGVGLGLYKMRDNRQNALYYQFKKDFDSEAKRLKGIQDTEFERLNKLTDQFLYAWQNGLSKLDTFLSTLKALEPKIATKITTLHALGVHTPAQQIVLQGLINERPNLHQLIQDTEDMINDYKAYYTKAFKDFMFNYKAFIDNHQRRLIQFPVNKFVPKGGGQPQSFLDFDNQPIVTLGQAVEQLKQAILPLVNS